MRPVRSWGRLSAEQHDVVALDDPAAVPGVLAGARAGVAHGMGRSYGDVCLNPNGVLWVTTGLDRFIAFDDVTGRLTCEAGVLLRDIQRLAIPRGWVLPVTPGTQLATVGGAIANDVHGKNHHRAGSFGDHATRIHLARTDGEIIDCGPQLRPEWFAATVGGVGLTGVITEVDIQLRKVAGPWIDSETIPFSSLDEFFHLADTSEAGWEHTVAWIDCLSGSGERGIFTRGNPTDAPHLRLPTSHRYTMPVVPPFSLVNRLSLRPFNAAYYHIKKRHAGRHILHYEPFLYPLDNLLEWNRMYGPKGFFQYQSVVPRDVGRDAIQAMLREIAQAGDGSCLAVLKTFADREPQGLLSFCRPGVSLAIDFPNRGQATHALFARLDAVVREASGRIYMAKDARMPRDMFEAGYPRLADFVRYRDPGISSELSRRLMGS
jgi:FAD/FMN-containing dehydrogenase